MRLIDVPMGENDVNAKTVGDFLKELLLRLWEEADGFSGKRPFGNSDWQYQVYASLIKAGYDIGRLDEDGYVDDVDYAKADKLVTDAITEVFAIEAEPVKHGRWIGTADGYADGELVYDMWECSECGYDADGADEKPNWNYCPSCGALMED